MSEISWYPNSALRRIAGVGDALGQFFLPLMIITFCYVQMVRSVRRIEIASTGAGAANMSRAKKNIFKIMTIIIVFFAVSAGPREVYGPAELFMQILNYIIYYLFIYYFVCVGREKSTSSASALVCSRSISTGSVSESVWFSTTPTAASIPSSTW
jgi:hypothetical protein